MVLEPVPMTYELVGHTADVIVTATAGSLGALFGSLADGLAAAGCEDWPDTGGERFSVAVSAGSRKALLYDYLAELIYERDVRGVLPVDNAVTIDGPVAGAERSDRQPDAAREDCWSLRGEARGVPLDRVDAREIKAVTYSEMTVEETAEGWRGRVVFDV
jgi:SHS2 domain-containing protein